MKYYPLNKKALEEEVNRREDHIKRTPLSLREKVKALKLSLATLVYLQENPEHIIDQSPEHITDQTLNPIKLFKSFLWYSEAYRRQIKEVKSGGFNYTCLNNCLSSFYNL